MAKTLGRVPPFRSKLFSYCADIKKHEVIAQTRRLQFDGDGISGCPFRGTGPGSGCAQEGHQERRPERGHLELQDVVPPRETKTMSLTKKLLVSFAAMLGLVLLLGVGGLLVSRDLSGDLERAANVTARQQYLAGQVSAGAAELTSLERGSVLASMLGDAAHLQAYQQAFSQHAENLRKSLSELRKTADSREAPARLQNLEQQALAVTQAHEELRQAMGKQQMDAAMVIFAQKVQPSLEEIGRQAVSLVEQQNSDLASAAAASSAKSARSTEVTIALLLLALGVGAGVLWMVRRVGVALKDLAARMSESAERVSGGASMVSSSSHSLAAGASQQAASLEETSASTEEIASITRKNADHALQVAGLMQQSAEGAAGVNESLDRMVVQMNEIGNSSNKIARIIKIIFAG